MADNNKNPNECPDTGHEWDGIRELTNPPPRWWTIALYLSGLLVLVYFILYPSLPLVNGNTEGILGWTQINEYKDDMAKIQEKRAPFEDRIAAMSAEEILEDDELLRYAVGSSKVLYGDNCAACHGVGGYPQPGSGYPILAELLTEEEVDGLVEFVLSNSAGEATEAQWKLYNEKGCVACHGADAKGIQQLGSANLSDKVWRFSGEPDEIRHTILHGVNAANDPKTRIAVMPAWNEKLAVRLEAEEYGDDPEEYYEGDETQRLSETEIKKLAVYVHQLGGGVE